MATFSLNAQVANLGSLSSSLPCLELSDGSLDDSHPTIAKVPGSEHSFALSSVCAHKTTPLQQNIYRENFITNTSAGGGDAFGYFKACLLELKCIHTMNSQFLHFILVVEQFIMRQFQFPEYESMNQNTWVVYVLQREP